MKIYKLSYFRLIVVFIKLGRCRKLKYSKRVLEVLLLVEELKMKIKINRIIGIPVDERRIYILVDRLFSKNRKN